MRIRTYLYMLAAAILLPAILLSSLALRMLHHAERSAALRGLSETANGVALLVDRELYSAEAMLRVLAASPSLAARDFAAFDVQARQAGGARITVLDATGRERVNTSLPSGAALRGEVDIATVRDIIKGAQLVVSNLRPTLASGKLSAAVSMPVTLADGTSFVVARVFSSDHFVALVQGARTPPGWVVGIIDGNGNFLARNVNPAGLVGTQARPELTSAIRLRQNGQIKHRTIEGTLVYDAFARPSRSPWTVAVAAPVTLIESASRDVAIAAAGGLFVAMAAAMALAAWIGRMHVQSIERAVQAAIDLGHGIAPPARRSRVIEVHALHTALHAAGEQLLQAHAYRKHAETERQSLLEGAQRARALAEQQNSAKDQFLAMLGHELRNPLAPISTAAQLLRLRSPDAARVRYASDVIARQVDHMNSLLGDLLDVSRVTRGLVSINLQPVELGVAIERALEQTNGLLAQQKHRLIRNIPDEVLMVQGDKTRLIQIFANLLNNAAKYTPAGGQISVAVRTDAGQVSVTVEDNGEGFSDELLPRIFDLFSQGDRAPDRAQGGLGLGLALVQRLVKLHGGSVTAHSAGVGQGSRFCVTFPYSPQSAPRRPEPPPRLERALLSVMIVDDNIDGAISLCLFLEEAGGHRVSTYYDAGSALASAEAETPDVLILDIGLPDMSGYELARRLRAMPRLEHATFIALTGYGQPHDKQMAFDAGFDHHLSKPADPQAILALLERTARHA